MHYSCQINGQIKTSIGFYKGLRVNEGKKFPKVNFRNLLIYQLSRLGITFMRTRTLRYLLNEQNKYRSLLCEIEFIKKYGINENSPFVECHRLSKSQLTQDMWVAIASGFKRNGTFVEIGAADGVTFSNTFMLEKVLGWQGVLVEPSAFWYDKLNQNRIAHIDTRCCTGESGRAIKFLNTRDPLLSSISTNRFSDSHASERFQGVESSVLSVSLNDIFIEYKLPSEIDYLSIDTEGNEFEILSNFDFNRFKFKFATIENGFDTKKSLKIQSLLAIHGYTKVHDDVSEFDDFYIRNSNA